MKSRRTRESNKPKENVRSLLLPDSFTQVEKEVKLAHGRIGITTVARLKWLLDFAYEDLDKLSQGQLSDRGWEIAALIVPADFQVRTGNKINLNFEILSFDVLTQPNPKVSEQLIRKFHDLLKQGMDDFFKGPGWKITVPEREKTIGLMGPPHYWRFVLLNGLPLEDQLIITVFNLFDSEVNRLGNCRNPNCKRPFVSTRKGKASYCSPRCSAYVRVNKARGKPEKLKGI